MPSTSYVRIQGLNALLKKLEPETLCGQPLRRAFEQAREYGQSLARKRAPGNLGSQIGSRVDPSPIPLFTTIGFSSEPTHNGFRFARALDAAKHRRQRGQQLSRAQKRAAAKSVRRVTKQNAPYTYDSGPSAGRPTWHWLSAAAGSTRRKFKTLLENAARQIESDFKR